MMPFWFWFLTMTAGLTSIALSSITVIVMKLREIDARQSRASNVREG